jgi:hypothetical protein
VPAETELRIAKRMCTGVFLRKRHLPPEKACHVAIGQMWDVDVEVDVDVDVDVEVDVEVDVDQGSSDTWGESRCERYRIRPSLARRYDYCNYTALGRRGSTLPVSHDYYEFLKGLVHMQQEPCQKPQ